MDHPPLSVLIAHARKLNNQPIFSGDLLCIDPGETTGYSRFECSAGFMACVEQGQLVTPTVQKFTDEFRSLIIAKRPTFVVYEEYRVYPWLLKQHGFSDIPTLRMVGAIQAIVHIEGIQAHGQIAMHPKNFVTNIKLKAWGLDETHANRHAADSKRHGIYWLCFGNAGDPNAKPEIEGQEN
jgi:hypothetical protein